MGATNSTLHYNLSQFISTDKPAWLQDYNGDMQKIDTGINGALTAAESAQNSADSASSGVSSLGDAVSALSTTVSGHTSDITDLSGDVNTIESLIGNGTPTAGDHTLIGAINANTADIASTNERIDANIFNGSGVEITSYTSSFYVAPSDGYLLVTAGTISGSSISAGVYSANATNIATDGKILIYGAGGASNGIFVRKGAKLAVNVVAGNAGAYFIPLV